MVNPADHLQTIVDYAKKFEGILIKAKIKK